MNLDAVLQDRGLFANSGLLSRVREFATSLRTAGHPPGGLLLVGTPDHEPWHFAAHLDDAARLSGQPQLAPTLVRHHVPVGAAPHLAIDLSRIHTAARGQTVLLVAPTQASDDLLNRIFDARRAGAVILTITANDPNLADIAHDALTVAHTDASPSAISTPADATIDTIEHLVSLNTHQPTPTSSGTRRHIQRLSRSLTTNRR
jgi:hypothetical protein